MFDTIKSTIYSLGRTLIKPIDWLIENPTVKLLLLMGLILSLFISVGVVTSVLISDIAAVIASFAVGLIVNIGVYWFSDKLIVLLTGAKNVDNDPKFAEIKQMVNKLTAEANKLDPKLQMKTPRLYFMRDRANAFATGRNPQNGIVCMTSDLLKLFDLNHNEDKAALKAILAHEISHIRHRDTFFMTSVAVVMNLLEIVAKTSFYCARANLFDRSKNNDTSTLQKVSIFAATLVLSSIIMPFSKILGTCFLSRTREYGADRGAFELMQNEKPMIRALRKLQKHVENPEFSPATEKNSSKLSRFDGVKAMCVSPDEVLNGNNTNKKSHFIVRFFKWLISEGISTHPTFDNRVKALNELAEKQRKERANTPPRVQVGKPLFHGYQPPAETNTQNYHQGGYTIQQQPKLGYTAPRF